MFEKLQIVSMAQAMASHAGDRMGLIARNVANADTPGFKAMDLPSFAETWRETAPDGMRQTRPGHGPGLADRADLAPQPVRGTADPNGNTVSLEAEMVRAADARQEHEMALAIYRATSDIIRSSLGRK